MPKRRHVHSLTPAREMPRPQPSRTHYSLGHYARPEIVSTYEQDRYGGPAGQWLLKREADLYRSLIPRCRLLLDVGAGTGKLLRALHDRAPHRIGVDASLPMLRDARTRQADAWFLVADAHHLPIRSASVDWVVSSRVLLHVESWTKVVEEISRTSAEGVVVDVPTATSFAPLEAAFRRLLGLSQPYRFFRLKALRRAFHSHAMRQDTSVKEFFFPYRLHRTLKRPAVSAWLERAAAALRLTTLWGNPAVLRFRRSPAE